MSGPCDNHNDKYDDNNYDDYGDDNNYDDEYDDNDADDLFRNHLGASECLKKVKDEEAWNFKVMMMMMMIIIIILIIIILIITTILIAKVWVANDDREVEGKFENW